MLIKNNWNFPEAKESEEYGICEDYGKEVSIERLKA